MDNKSKKNIIKKAIKSRSPLVGSKANRGIYQNGPWSDSLSTTNVTLDSKVGDGKNKSKVKI